MPSHRVIAMHRPPAYPPLELKAGARVTVGRRDDEWPEFLWCTGDDGQAGWIPESYLDRNSENSTLNRDYDATELAAQVGDQVTEVEHVGGWLWCRNQRGEFGWIPERNLSLERGLRS